MGAYYNEIEPFAAEWLRNLILCDLIADGEVDTRSVEDVRPADLQGFTQCHFFAGIGIWSAALRGAGWPDTRPVWTGSCPCQPFSAAGRGGGMGDERHLWPAWHHLVSECRPSVLLGEQVASAAAAPWLDLVHTDLETLGYAFGAVPFPAASVGAPHIRDRLYWVAHAAPRGLGIDGCASRQAGHTALGGAVGANGLAHADGATQHAFREGEVPPADEWPKPRGVQLRVGGCGSVRGLAHPSGEGFQGHEFAGQRVDAQREASQRGGGAGGVGDADEGRGGRDARAVPGAQEGAGGCLRGEPDCAQPPGPTGPANGWWAGADWLPCRDGKARPVEPGTFPLAHGCVSRVGRLRAYGNAIVQPQAEAWIKTVMECMPC